MKNKLPVRFTLSVIGYVSILFGTVQAQTQTFVPTAPDPADASQSPAATTANYPSPPTRQPAQQSRRRNVSGEVVMQSIGGALIIICNVTNRCGGFTATLATTGRTEYPQYSGATPPIFSEGSAGTTSVPTARGPVFPFAPSANGLGTVRGAVVPTNQSSAGYLGSVPAGWNVTKASGSTTVAPPSGKMDGNLNNGVIFGSILLVGPAESVATRLISANSYLRGDGATYAASIGSTRCYKFQYAGYSHKSHAMENVDVYVCPKSNGYFYAISVSSGADAEGQKVENVRVIRGLRLD